MIAGHRSERPCHHAIDEVPRKLSARFMYDRPIPEEVASKVCSGLCMLALFAFSKDAIVQAQEAAGIDAAGSCRPTDIHALRSSGIFKLQASGVHPDPVAMSAKSWMPGILGTS